MPKVRAQKQQEVANYLTKIQGSKAMYFLKPVSMSANQSNALKMSLFDVNSTFNVVKNTLFIKAIKDSGLNIGESTDIFASGEHAVLFANDDLAAPAKKLKEFLSEDAHKNKLEILGGYLEGKFVSKEQVIEVADLPTKEVLLSQMLGIIDSVVAGIARTSTNPTQEIYNALGAMIDEGKVK